MPRGIKNKLDWETIEKNLKSSILSGEISLDEENIPYVMLYLGSVMSLYPSGKYYTAWTTNQTDEDVEMDQKFAEELQTECSKHNAWIESGEGDPTDLFVVRSYTWKQIARILNKDGADSYTIMSNIDAHGTGYGSEVIRKPGAWHNYYGDMVAEYINMGDAYIETLWFLVPEEKFVAGDHEAIIKRLGM